MITLHWPRATHEALAASADVCVSLPTGARYLCHSAVLSLDSSHLATLAALAAEQAAEQAGTLPELRLSAASLPAGVAACTEEEWTAFLTQLYGGNECSVSAPSPLAVLRSWGRAPALPARFLRARPPAPAPARAAALTLRCMHVTVLALRRSRHPHACPRPPALICPRVSCFTRRARRSPLLPAAAVGHHCRHAGACRLLCGRRGAAAGRRLAVPAVPQPRRRAGAQLRRV